MFMKTRGGEIILSIAALCIGTGLLADAGLTFGMRVLYGKSSAVRKEEP